ncbi:MAG TPA: hypothetical protein VFR46_12555 [Actinomycetes bacterium]|nr:hypothetical protein [Actinomycetes bacterium]
MSEQASARLDLVVRRRDRLVEASAVWLFLVVLTYIYWMIVLLPVFRYGLHGLREVRNEDRIRARLIDGFVLLVLMIVVVLRFVPPSLGNIISGFSWCGSCSRFRSPRGAG